MQVRIIPKPQKRSDILDVLKVVGIVTHEDDDRVVLQFDNGVSLERLTKRYPELGELLSGIPR